jgi:hypothetical protein
MPVGGSRHYDGGGLGQEAGWKCPSCGGENAGPIAQGCTRCGAGTPGRHIGRDAPPPAPSEPELRQGDIATVWAETHPGVSVEEAYRAGYLDGVRAVRALPPPHRAAEPPLDPQTKIARTIVAALGYFADQILSGAPPEVESGEWCSVAEVRTLIHQLTTTGEVVHG